MTNAEIEKLRKRVNFVEQANVQLREELKQTTEKFNCQQYVYADLSDIIREKNAEIERLKKDCFCIANERDAIGDCMNEAVEEAIKEFAEKVKTVICENTTPQFDINGNPINVWKAKDGYRLIDTLVKEMVGDTE